MKERISILINYLPRYGEILLGVGNMAISHQEALLDNLIAREKLKEYLLYQAPKRKSIISVANSEEFQRIIYEYTGNFVNMAVIKDPESKNKIVNILLADFFSRSIWPILVNKYIDTIHLDLDKVIVSINVKKNVYLKIYDEDNPNLFFKEFKEYLLCNYIVICEATVKENGDMLLRLMLPVPPSSRYEY